jgi:hypothetical protein
MAPRPSDRPRNHLTATRKEPETPSSDSRMHRSNRQGEPPAHTESGEPSTGRTESTHHQGGRSGTKGVQYALYGPFRANGRDAVYPVRTGGHLCRPAWQAREPRGRQTSMTTPHCPRAVRILPKGWLLSRWRQSYTHVEQPNTMHNSLPSVAPLERAHVRFTLNNILNV